MKPANFTITTPANFKDWKNNHNTNGNGIDLFVENNYNTYARFEWLCNCCLKQFKKYGGLDLDYLLNSSILKDITRGARKALAKYGEQYTMQEDKDARAALVVSVWDYVTAE